jgi:hypothetical protein
MNEVDGVCRRCGKAIRVLSGAPQLCSDCENKKNAGARSAINAVMLHRYVSRLIVVERLPITA